MSSERPAPTGHTVTLDRYADCLDAYRSTTLRQALYDEGEVIMADVLVNLHGEPHRQRRRLENRLFRRATYYHYEDEVFPGIVDETLAPLVAAGRADLVHLGHALLLNLSAPTAGVDRIAGTSAETAHLFRLLMTFIEGATLAHSTRDKDEVRREVLQALDDFDATFFSPAQTRRQALLARLAAGEIGEDELPRDILTVLLRNQDDLELPREIVRREVAFFLLAGAHTSATATTRTTHAIFEWIRRHPEDRNRARSDLGFVQRCVHETVRLNPSSPIGLRWALEDVRLASGIEIRAGDRVVFDLMAANRDVRVFGPSAAVFDPFRSLPQEVPLYGLSFGSGMHACIGRDLAAGVLEDTAPGEKHLYGLVAIAVHGLLARGARPDPRQAPTMDPHTKRPYWGTYPILLGGAAGAAGGGEP